MKGSELKTITKKVYEGNADKVEQMYYKQYIACWGI